jgi:hypothetical protein
MSEELMSSLKMQLTWADSYHFLHIWMGDNTLDSEYCLGASSHMNDRNRSSD